MIVNRLTRFLHSPAFLLGLLALVSLGAYLVASRLTYRVGFPLDDAWIHQTYARNLAQRAEWSFTPGQVSGGSTAPLWSLLLSLSYLVKINPFIWTFLVGGSLLWGLGMLAESAFRSLFPEAGPFPWVGAVLIFEWHLVWAAGSGMETLLAAVCVCTVIFSLLQDMPRWLAIGLVIGISVWVRPDGITLLGPVLLSMAMTLKQPRAILRPLIRVVTGFGIPFLGYLAFNRITAGSWWPNTFYAKQTEYAVMQQIPFWQRLISEFEIPLVGVGAVLLPGVLYLLWNSIKTRDWRIIPGFLWFAGFISLYAWRLPVTYQHGRYILPALPLFLFWGICGARLFYTRINPGRVHWIITRSWIASIAVVTMAFWVIGSWTYAQDVAIIETEMVDSSRWIAANTLPGSLVAAHDIGALGYFGNRNIVDLAGLVSPDVIPFMRQEQPLAAYLDRKEVSYLMTFPDWYPELVGGAIPVFQSTGKYAPGQGHANMVIYRWGR